MKNKELYCFFLPISYEYKFLVYVNDEDNKGPYMFNPSINRYCMLYGWTTSKKLAKKFIKHCCNNNALSISFILPKSFKKISM